MTIFQFSFTQIDVDNGVTKFYGVANENNERLCWYYDSNSAQYATLTVDASLTQISGITYYSNAADFEAQAERSGSEQ